MVREVKLRNSDKHIIFDEKVYNWLATDPKMVMLKVLDYLYLSNTPRVTYNKRIRIGKNQFERHCFYLHTLIGEQFIGRPKSEKNLVVTAANGNLLDCRLENLSFQPRGVGTRKAENKACKTGFRGVHPAGNRYKAVINVDGKRYHIGYYATARLAAIAFNEVALRRLGVYAKLNVIPDIDPEPAKLMAKKHSRNQAANAMSIFSGASNAALPPTNSARPS